MVTFWPRINTVLLLILLLAVIGLLATRAYGGPLDPPGAPAQTDGVRGPGTPISSLPFTISEAGYYYVTRNLTAPGGLVNGITINGSNVTVDLGGFTLTGGDEPGHGIVNSGARNIVIRNGAVRGWDVGIFLDGTYSRVENVHALSNETGGIVVGPGSQVVGCNASLNGDYGISVNYATVRNCTVAENGALVGDRAGIEVGSYSLIEQNRVNSTVDNGIRLIGGFNTIRSNDLSGSANGFDLSFAANTTGNVAVDNVFCDVDSGGTIVGGSGNIDRIENC